MTLGQWQQPWLHTIRRRRRRGCFFFWEHAYARTYNGARTRIRAHTRSPPPPPSSPATPLLPLSRPSSLTVHFCVCMCLFFFGVDRWLLAQAVQTKMAYIHLCLEDPVQVFLITSDFGLEPAPLCVCVSVCGCVCVCTTSKLP